MRDEKTKKAFIKYLEENPEERFWQAVRNFTHAPFLYVSDKMVELQDTFYIESDKKGEE